MRERIDFSRGRVVSEARAASAPGRVGEADGA